MNTFYISRSARPTRKVSRGVFATLLCASTVALAIGASSCATTRGLGNDIQAGGRKIEKAAN